jgi:primosomal protein N' (replication factor Y)
VLGSATPAVETYHATETGMLTRLELPSRVTSQALPKVDIVDLRRHKSGPSGHPLITVTLHRAIEACIAKKEQAILFLNRRGFAPSIQCDACGVVVKCPACSVSLTEHKYQREFRCHYCDFKMAATLICPACKEESLEPLGHGTERIEDVLQNVFSNARVGRLDRDAVKKDGGENVMSAFRRGDIDILVGTQMVTKGHDIANVTLVGILLGEQSLGFPDFRAAERTFQLMTQVAGRAGRGDQPGHVILQTFQPEHSVMTFAIEHDFVGFYKQEVMDRKELGFPPFGRLLAVRVDAADDAVASWAIATLAGVATQAIRTLVDETKKPRVLGPAQAPIARVRGRYRYRMLVLGKHPESLRNVAHALLERIEAGLKTARASLDVDPVSML